MAKSSMYLAAFVITQIFVLNSAFSATARKYSCLSPDQATRFEIQMTPSLVDPEELSAQLVTVYHRNGQNSEHEVARFDAKSGLLNNSDSLVVMYFDTPNEAQSFARDLGMEAAHSMLLDLDDVTDSPLPGQGRTVPAQVIFMLNSGSTMSQDFSCHQVAL